MGGKLPLIGVIGFGLVAAVCAAVLMAVLRIEPSSASAETATVVRTAPVVVAAADLGGQTRLREDHLEVREVPAGEVPPGSVSDPVSLIGRVLNASLLKGQAVLTGSLLEEEAGAKLALSLPEGLRAVSVELDGSSAMRGLIYPGSRVDVLSAPRGGGGSRTLIQNAGVLAVGDRTVFSEADGEGDDGEGRSSRGSARRVMVTLMVDPAQARAIQAARERGELSLSLRNPLDVGVTAEPLEAASMAPTAAAEVSGPWRVRVIRGSTAEVREFGTGGEGAEAPASAGNGRRDAGAADDPPSGEDR